MKIKFLETKGEQDQILNSNYFKHNSVKVVFDIQEFRSAVLDSIDTLNDIEKDAISRKSLIHAFDHWFFSILQYGEVLSDDCEICENYLRLCVDQYNSSSREQFGFGWNLQFFATEAHSGEYYSYIAFGNCMLIYKVEF